MKHFTNRTCILFFLFIGIVFPFYINAQTTTKARSVRTRIMIAPVISFYKINKNHASGVAQRMSGIISMKEEFRLNSSHTMFLSIGAEYFIHGLKFSSYYFKPDSLQLYDGEMKYAYNLYMHELDIPIQLRISFKKENNSIFAPYLVMGYHLRTFLLSNVKVKQEGEQVIKKESDIRFKNPLFSNKLNPFVSLSLGIQTNKPNTNKLGYFAEIGFRFGFSPYLLKETFTPSSLYLNGNHLSVGLGIKF